jgi:heme-degrading monooxygenase HmoA
VQSCGSAPEVEILSDGEEITKKLRVWIDAFHVWIDRIQILNSTRARCECPTVEDKRRAAGVLATTSVRPDATLVTIQELHVAPGTEEEFVARFTALDVLGLAADAAGGELLEAVVLQDGARFLVVTSWVSPAGLDGWIDSPARERVRDELEPLYERPAVVNRYPIRVRYPSDRGRAHREQRRCSD